MSEFSLSPTTLKKTNFSSLLLSDLFLFCSFILSHPLYFFYFIFFFPYLFKLLSFLSPLFITTFLLLSVFFTLSPSLVYEGLSTEFAESKVSFMLGTYQAVVDRLRSKVEEDGDIEFDQFEELEAYKIVFATSDLDIGENLAQDSAIESKENSSATDKVDENKSSIHEDYALSVGEVLKDENSAEIPRSESSQLIVEVKKLSVFLDEKDEFEEFSSPKGEKEVKSSSENFKKVKEKKEELYTKSGSKEMGHKLSTKASDDGNVETLTRMNSWSPENGGEYTPRVIDYSPSLRSNLGSFGSMRKEKEWRRTLACKLFEERHNVDGGEGMDLLWETYETDSMKLQAKSKSKKGKKLDYEEEEEVEEEEEEEENDGQLCCLQALKFSAGKMNLGMGRPNLVKFSKALKGIGWLHHVSKKKSYH